MFKILQYAYEHKYYAELYHAFRRNKTFFVLCYIENADIDYNLKIDRLYMHFIFECFFKITLICQLTSAWFKTIYLILKRCDQIHDQIPLLYRHHNIIKIILYLFLSFNQKKNQRFWRNNIFIYCLLFMGYPTVLWN